MLKIGTDIEVLKGKHKGKTGVIEKIHAVYVTILFENGSSGRTLPSSLKVTVVPFESAELYGISKESTPTARYPSN